MSHAKTAIDRDGIRRWAEKLDQISWEQSFKIFEESRLALLRQDTTAGGNPSRFAKFVHCAGDQH
jgi:hypothetical protein